jgi:hypothetical protein
MVKNLIFYVDANMLAEGIVVFAWNGDIICLPNPLRMLKYDSDSVHEQVSYDLVALNKEIFTGILDGGRIKRYKKTPEDRVLFAARANVLYSGRRVKVIPTILSI